MEWILLTTQQPPFDTPVLVKNDKDNESNIARLESVRETSEGKTFDFLEGRTSYDTYYKDITHWMPTP